MRYRVGCELQYLLSTPSTLIFNVAVVESAAQKIIEEKLVFAPALKPDEMTDHAGNRFHRLTAGEGELKLSYHALVEHTATQTEEFIPEVPVEQLPADVISYLYPSRYCPSDKFARVAERTFGHLTPGASRVTAVCNWIYDNVEYQRGNTDEHTSAMETLVERVGVCRDFAHLGITLCRTLNIPARFVSAYAYQLDPPDFHACFEAYLGGKWYVFDATRLAPPAGFVRIGVGRDAADTSFASIFGAAEMTEMSVSITPIAGAQKSEDFPAFTTATVAIS